MCENAKKLSFTKFCYTCIFIPAIKYCYYVVTVSFVGGGSSKGGGVSGSVVCVRGGNQSNGELYCTVCRWVVGSSSV